MASRPHQLRSIQIGDDPQPWADLGFHVAGQPDPDDRSVLHLGATALVLTGSGAGFESWNIAGVGEALDGLAASTTGIDPATGEVRDPQHYGGSAAPHPNGISAIDHVVVTSGDVDRTAAALAGAGLVLRGSRHRTGAGQSLRQLFYWLGDVILELVGPDEGEPTTGDPASVFGLALVAPQLDATVEHLGELAGTPRPAVQEGRRIAPVRGRALGISLQLAVMSPHPR